MMFSNRKRSWERMIVGMCFVGNALGCAPAAEDGGAERIQDSGLVVFSLQTTAASGAIYHLQDALFIIRDAQGETVAALSTAAEPDAEVLSAKVNEGFYTIELRDGWSLLRTFEGTSATVSAQLSGPSSVEAFVARDAEVVVPFSFVVDEGTLTFAQGTLGVRIVVEEVATCGNGLLEPGEVCDDGALTGRRNRCDTACQFQCEGACPLRVDPEVTDPGNGASWSAPLASLQAAIDIQSALGGGQVWLRGPGPFDALTATGVEPLITLRPYVSLYGGFGGTETRLTDRAFDATTILSSAQDVADPAEPIIVGASGSSLESFTFLTPSITALHFQNADTFLVTNVTIDGGALSDAGSQISVVDSSGTFQGLAVRNGWTIDGVAGMRCIGSNVRVTGSQFQGMHTVSGTTGIATVSSMLVLHDVQFIENRSQALGGATGLELIDSRALVMASLWLGNLERVTVDVRRSELVAVDSHWEANSSDGPIVFIGEGSSAQLLNSSLVDNRSTASAAVFTPGELELTNVTFLDNEGFDHFSIIADDVYVLPPHARATIQNVFTNSGDRSIAGAFTGVGNCIVGEDAPVFVSDELGHREVFLTAAIGCADVGDAIAARRAARRASGFAREFDFELLFPPPSSWWRELTSIYPLCRDDGPIDPGRHYRRPDCEQAE